jgi:hypothetical protein
VGFTTGDTEIDELILSNAVGVSFPDAEPRLTDWRGNEYGVGSKILYPRSEGRSVEMQEGIVEKITPRRVTRYNYQTKRDETKTEHTVQVRQTRSSRFTAWTEAKLVTITVWRNITAVT